MAKNEVDLMTLTPEQRDARLALDVERLLRFGRKHKLIKDLDVLVARNTLLDLLALAAPSEAKPPKEDPETPAALLDEMVELMVETVCSTRRSIRIAGNDIPQAVVKSRLLKLDGEHIRFVFDCLQRNTTEIRNMKQYLLAVLYNAPVTMENHYASQVNHDLYGKAA